MNSYFTTAVEVAEVANAHGDDEPEMGSAFRGKFGSDVFLGENWMKVAMDMEMLGVHQQGLRLNIFGSPKIQMIEIKI